MDSEDINPDVGTHLPLPPNIDGSCDESLENDEEPPHLDEDPTVGVEELFGSISDLDYDDAGLDVLGQTPSPPADDPERPRVSTDVELTEREKSVLDSMVHQAMMSADLTDSLALPWETGVMATIFSDAPLVAAPELPRLAHTIDHAESARRTDELGVERVPKKQRTDGCGYKLYERAICFKNTMSDLETDQAKWNRALEKLYTVMVSGPSSRPVGVNFSDEDMDRNLHQIRVLCGARSPNTIAKRANSLLQFCVWHRSYFYNRHPIPFEQDCVADYVWEKQQDGATYSFLISFVEAINFGTYVLGLPVKDPSKGLVSKFVQGVLDQKALTRPKRRQARPLTVSEVAMLEETLKDAKVDLLDRYAAGAFLFALYGRCRWSDLRKVNNYVLDTSTMGSKTIGYLEFSTFSHKTAAQVARHGLPLPLVAPIWGLTSPCWAVEWAKIAQEVGMNFDESFDGPILPAPDKCGDWCARSITATEATKWLNELLRQSTPDLEHVTSHSLKCTTLSWLAKAGTEPHYRLLLGHHSTQKGSLETYSRDVLSAPLRALDDVLRRIRMGALHPDLTRSGHVQEPSQPDCAEEHTEQNEGPSSSSDSDSSSSSNSDSSEDELPNTNNWRSIAESDPHVKKSAWGSGVMHQHALSKIVHLQLSSNPVIFKCGMHATRDHKVVRATSFLESRKCRRCTKVIDAA